MTVNCTSAKAHPKNSANILCIDGRFGKTPTTDVPIARCAKCANRKPIYAEHPAILTMFQKPIPPPAHGVGSEIKRILSSMGISSCQQCLDKAAEWDANGLDWCIEHRQEIIEHLIAQGKAKGWVWWKAAQAGGASTVVDLAIASRERQIMTENETC